MAGGDGELARLTRVAARVLRGSAALLSRPSAGEHLFESGPEPLVRACREILKDGAVRELIEGGSPLVLSDTRRLLLRLMNGELRGRPSACIAAPLRPGTAESPYLWVLRDEGGGWSEDDLELLQDLAEAAGSLIEHELESERQREALRLQVAYLEQLFETRSEGVVLLDRADRVLRANEAFLQMFGYAAPEVKGRLLNDLIVPAELRREADLLSIRASEGTLHEVTLERCRKDGRRLHVSLQVRSVQAAGSHAGTFAIYRDVSDHRRAQEALRKNESRFRSLIEHSSDLVVVLDGGGTIEYLTPSVERMLGYSVEELLGTSAFGLLHPADAPAVMDAFSLMLKDPPSNVSAAEFRVRTNSGEWRNLDVRAKNLLDDPGVSGVVLNSRDVTDERRAEETQRRLGSFLEATPDFVATFDPHGRALSVNSAFRKVLGLESEADLSSLTISDLYPHQVTQVLRHEGIPTAVREGVWRGETSLQGVDGTEIPISQVILAHRSDSGAVEFLSSLARDITERKTAEAALRRSEEHFRTLIENALDIITILDGDGRILFESPSIERVLGHSPAAVLGREISELVHPDDAPRLRELLSPAPGTREVSAAVELRWRHTDGSWRTLESVSENLLNDPAVAGIVMNSRDVTERRAAEAALHESQAQLLQSQKMEAVGRLAGGIAHDFNNLLTAIKGFTELLLLDFSEQDTRRSYASEIQSAANRAAGLTRQLLAFSRKQVLQPKVLDLNASVSDMEKMLRRLIGEDVALETLQDPQLGRVRADPGQMEQVILNLAVNARDAMPSGGRLTIRTCNGSPNPDELRRHRDVPAGSFVALSVADTGAGMPPEVRERVFEPFFTTKEQGKGTGLGLSTVYGIVRQSGGIVRVESELGAGTTFTIFLPRVEEDVDRADDRAAAGALDGSETVLLAEDELAVRVLIRRVLDRLGYRVLEAANGAEALELLQKLDRPVDLLLTDVVMPGMSGRELADKVTERNPSTKVLFMSGYTDEAIVKHGVLNEGVAFLEKPFTPEVLLRKLREVLAASAPREHS